MDRYLMANEAMIKANFGALASQWGGSMVNIHLLLQEIEKDDNISDLHLAAGEVAAVRYNGDILKLDDLSPITGEWMELTLKTLLQNTPESYTKFWSDKDMDFSFVSKQGVSYRVNAFIKTWKLALVMRKINAKAAKISELMYEDIASTLQNQILAKKAGLFLVTGPTGSWKSTTLIAMLEYLNQTRNEHIITIEDPIEYLFTPAKALISQRELDNDTWSFANALRAAMREDPDVIFVGEIRDRDTAEAALNMAETGHLVFSTLHTKDAASTVNRYISFFPPDIQDSIADRLATSLLGVQSQFLIRTKDLQSRVWLFELLLNTTSVRNNIKKKEINQIQNIIETSSSNWMITHKMYAQRLIEQNLIDPASVSRLMQ